jgi:hypothetical protein
MFFVTLLTGFFIALQWKEIGTSSVDTHDLAVAAKSQASNTENLAKSAVDQVGKLREQVDQLRRSADETHVIADTAKQSLATSVNIFQAENRPWLNMWLEPTYKISAGAKISINFQVNNGGRSPAIGVSNIVCDYKIVKTEELDNFMMSLVIKPLGHKEHIVAASEGNVATAFSDHILSSEEVERINNGKEHIVAWGRVDYYGPLGRRQPYYTEICQGYNPVGLSWSPCPVHNTMK